MMLQFVLLEFLLFFIGQISAWPNPGEVSAAVRGDLTAWRGHALSHFLFFSDSVRSYSAFLVGVVSLVSRSV